MTPQKFIFSSTLLNSDILYPTINKFMNLIYKKEEEDQGLGIKLGSTAETDQS